MPGESRTQRKIANDPLGFNPLPAIMPGESSCLSGFALHPEGFNPLPAIMPGESSGNRLVANTDIVSIHSRQLCRENQDRERKPSNATKFQSTPGNYAGRIESAANAF